MRKCQVVTLQWPSPEPCEVLAAGKAWGAAWRQHVAQAQALAEPWHEELATQERGPRLCLGGQSSGVSRGWAALVRAGSTLRRCGPQVSLMECFGHFSWLQPLHDSPVLPVTLGPPSFP